MDILRRELEEIYAGQRLQEETLDRWALEGYRRSVGRMADMTRGCCVITDAASKWNDRVYMTGDFDHAGIDYKPDYADAGFSGMVNFYFPKHGDLDGIVYTWQAYADSVAAHPGWHPFNYLNNSYHRDADMDNMADCATTFLLSPGVAQIFYGDETRRKLSDARFNVDSDQAFRSDMDWNEVDSALLEHFQRLGRIRRENPVIGTGRQRTLDTHTALRYNDRDSILIRLRPEDGESINLYGIFEDGDTLKELYTGRTGTVCDGRISLPVYRNHIALFKKQ